MDNTNPNPQRKLRRGLFWTALGILTALFVAIAGPILPYMLTGWFPALSPDLETHRVHDVAIATALAVALAGVLAHWRRPATRVAPWQQAVLVFSWIFVVRAASADIFPPLLVFLGLLALVGAMHPARAKLLQRPSGRPLMALLALAVVLVVAAAPYALDHVAIQRAAAGTDEPHAAAGHWSTMAAVAVLPGLLVALAALRTPGWRLTAASGAALAAFTGGASMAFPFLPSAYPTWAGVGAISWAVTVVVLTWRADATATPTDDVSEVGA